MPISKIATIHVGTCIHGFLYYGMLLIVCVCSSFYTIHMTITLVGVALGKIFIPDCLITMP